MAGGLVALLDDVAALARLAAASVDDVAAAAGRASTKAAGVVIDDAAVTPRYVEGLRPDRELSIIGRIAKGSIRNKVLIILPIALLLSQFAPWALTPILMIGGAYLCYEGAEKIYEMFSGKHAKSEPASARGKVDEDAVVSGAIRTDFILSAEIMVIALNEVADEPLVSRAAILLVVAIAITALVYGAVAAIVRMDDVGLALSQRPSQLAARVGRGLVRAMPLVLSTLSTVGIVAMLWVGGHIWLVGTDDLGWPWMYEQVHRLEVLVKDATGSLGGTLAWVTNTFFSAIIGLVLGGIIVAIAHLLPRRKKTADPAQQ